MLQELTCFDWSLSMSFLYWRSLDFSRVCCLDSWRTVDLLLPNGAPSRSSCKWKNVTPVRSNSETCLKRSLKKKTKNGFQDRLSLNAGQKYCRMLKESILQYFRPSLSYHLSLRHFFCLFLSGRLIQVLLYLTLMSRDMWFTTMRHFDKFRLRRACAASF